MFIELIDLLRCTNDHLDTWLVASFRNVNHRFVEEATLGCPSCSAQYAIREGVAYFGDAPVDNECEHARAEASHRREELATRAGAYLDATQPGATFVLGGLWAHAASDLAAMTDVRVIAINGAQSAEESERVGLVRTADKLPLAPESVAGVALDAWFPNSIVASAIRAVRPGGRIVGPASFAVPDGLTTLAHDERYWVAEKPGVVVPLRRATTGS